MESHLLVRNSVSPANPVFDPAAVHPKLVAELSLVPVQKKNLEVEHEEEEEEEEEEEDDDDDDDEGDEQEQEP